MDSFYTNSVGELLRQGLLRADMKVLVLCVGKLDQETLLALGFRDVTISNLDVRMSGSEYGPYSWSFQDAEKITYPDESFDFCIAHSGLHHCYSPHRALLEMYRVCTRGLLVIEPRDNFITRLGVRLNFGQEYEVAAVYANDCAFGGVRNTEIPNYVYRWTEREVEKTISSYAPWGKHRFVFRYANRIPWGRLKVMKSKSRLILMMMLAPLMALFFKLFPRQSNNFAFAVFKPQEGDLHPWIRREKEVVALNERWVAQHYATERPAVSVP